MESTAADTAGEPDRQHELGLLTLTMMVVASMIGVVLFVGSGYAIGSLRSPERVLLAWALCGAWAIAGAVAYGGLAKRLPYSGGEYLFLSRLMHPSVGFLAGWISLIAGFTAPIAAMAKAFVQYALPMLTDPTAAAIAATVVILIVSIAHAVGLEIGAWAQNAVVFVNCFSLPSCCSGQHIRYRHRPVHGKAPLYRTQRAVYGRARAAVGSRCWLRCLGSLWVHRLQCGRIRCGRIANRATQCASIDAPGNRAGDCHLPADECSVPVGA